MSAPPLVSVLMAVHDEDDYLESSVASILGQTFSDFEFVIVDDASSNERTAKILAGLKDSRIRLVRNNVNSGLTHSLNKGLGIAKGKYIARMDADDISTPERLEKQVLFLEGHPDVGIIGTGFCLMDAAGRKLKYKRMPSSDLGVRWMGLLSNPFVHSSVMFRRETLLSKHLQYDETLPVTQDYDLWMRLLRHVRGANLNEYLLLSRVHAASVSVKRREEQLACHGRISCRAVRELLPGCGIASEMLGRLRVIIVEGQSWSAGDDGVRTELALLYLGMLKLFLEDNRKSAEVEEVRCLAFRSVLSGFVFSSPVLIRCSRVLSGIISLDPFIPRTLIRIVMRSLAQRLGL